MKAIERIINSAKCAIATTFENSEYQQPTDVSKLYNQLGHVYAQKINDLKRSGLFTEEESKKISLAVSEILMARYNETIEKVREELRMAYEF